VEEVLLRSSKERAAGAKGSGWEDLVTVRHSEAGKSPTDLQAKVRTRKQEAEKGDHEDGGR